MHRLISFAYIYLIPLFFSAIFSLKAFRLKWPKPYTIFSIFLISTLCVETLAIAWKWGLCSTAWWHFSPSNLWIYNGFVIIRHLFILGFFYGIIPSLLLRKLILGSVIPFLLFAVANYVFIQKPDNVNNYTIVLANTITILLVLGFFYQLLKDKQIISLRRSTPVWISFGAFLYYSGTLPLFIFFDYLLKHHLSMALSYLYINDGLNIIMYTSYLISFLCTPHSLK